MHVPMHVTMHVTTHVSAHVPTNLSRSLPHPPHACSQIQAGELLCRKLADATAHIELKTVECTTWQDRLAASTDALKRAESTTARDSHPVSTEPPLAMNLIFLHVWMAGSVFLARAR
jgi:hypothetical protein